MKNFSLFESSVKVIATPVARTLISYGLLAALFIPVGIIGQASYHSVRTDSSLIEANNAAKDAPQTKQEKVYPEDSTTAVSSSPEDGTCGWSAGTATSLSILDQATTSVGSNLYTFAGVSTSIIANSYKFDGTTWSSIASLPGEREFPAAVSDGTSAYIINGVDAAGTSQNTLYRYNPSTDTYTTLANSSSSTPTWNHAAAYLNGKIYKIGGYTSSAGTSASTSAVEIYDIASNTWSNGAPYPIAQGWMSAFVLGNYIYVAGGLAAETGSVPSTKTYRYDPSSNTWDDASIADLPVSRWAPASTVTPYVGTWVLAGGYVGGSLAANLSNTAVKWDPATNTWSDLPNMSQARARMTGAVLNGSFYVVGGRSSAGGFAGTTDNQKLFCVDTTQAYLQGSVAYVSDNGTPANGVPDPGETVTVNLNINNLGGVASGNVIATLQSTGGITNPSGPTSYGVINANSSTTKSFTFQVPSAAVCGSVITLTFDIADGATHYTTVKTYNLGVLQTALTQNFDGVTAPSLPSGWVQNQTTGVAITWTTTSASSSSAPNSITANDPGSNSAAAIESPAFNVAAVNSTVTFQNSYNTESTYDGMVFEIKIGSGAWTDILTAGGSFSSGGYNGTISTGFNSPIGGRQAWTGNSNGYITTTATLPASANGQSVQIRWLMASDDSVGSTGVNIDNVSVASGYLCNTVTTSVKSRADFDGDGKTDLSVFRPSEGNWYTNRSTAGFLALHFGASTDTVVPGDYDGDGKADFTVWRPTEGFYVLNSATYTANSYVLGSSTDKPVAGDFDGDGKSDIAVWTPSNGAFTVRGSQSGTVTVTQFGMNGDIPFTMDPDGDGKANFAVFRPSNATWYIASASDPLNYTSIQFGLSTDIIVPADYDGDNKDDVAVYRPSTGMWYILKSTGGVSYIQFGQSGDIPVPGDYDGDGKDDQAVYRSGVWYLNRSTAGFSASQFGSSTDVPVPAKYHP